MKDLGQNSAESFNNIDSALIKLMAFLYPNLLFVQNNP